MKTNKPKFKNKKKTGLNIQISQALVMNATQDIKILHMYL